MHDNPGPQMVIRIFYGLITFGIMGLGGAIGSIAGVLLAEYIRTPFEPMRGFLPAHSGRRFMLITLACAASPLLAVIAIIEFGLDVKLHPFHYTSVANDVVQCGISLVVMFFAALLCDEMPPRQRRLNDAASDAVAALARRVEISHANPDPIQSSR